MLLELGTTDPVGVHQDPQRRPVITYANIPDTYTFDPGVNTEAWRSHLTAAVMENGGITNFGNEEVIASLTHPGGLWPASGRGKPTWAWSDNADLQRFCSEYWGCPEGRPDYLDETHWRRAGNRIFAPGESMNVPDLSMLLVNSGCNAVAQNVGGGVVVPVTGTATAATATTLTTALTTSSTTQYTGARVYVMQTSTGPLVYGNILSCTNGTNAVLTVDQWYVPGTPGGSAATTPSSGYYFVIADGGDVSNWFMGLTTTNISPAATDTALSGESTASGMARKIPVFSVTSAASGSSITWTNVGTFTYGTSGALTFYAMGLFPSIVKSASNPAPLFWETSLSGSFTVTNNGDVAVVTDTITAT
jgi:hypothetical protein